MHSWIDYFGLGILEIFYAHPRLFHHRCWQLEETADSWKRQHATVQLSNKHSAGWELSLFLFWMQNLYRKTFGRITFSCRNNTTGILNQHSPLTMFRTRSFFAFFINCPTKTSVYIQNSQSHKGLNGLFLLFVHNFWIHSGHSRDLQQSQDEITMAQAFSTAWNYFSWHTQSWQRLILIGWFFCCGSYLNSGKLEDPSPDKVNGALIGRWHSTVAVRATLFFFVTNQQIWLSIYIY